MTDKEWVLDRFRFAAQTIQSWEEQFPDAAERMVKDVIPAFGDGDTRDAFLTAFGQ